MRAITLFTVHGTQRVSADSRSASSSSLGTCVLSSSSRSSCRRASSGACSADHPPTRLAAVRPRANSAVGTRAPGIAAIAPAPSSFAAVAFGGDAFRDNSLRFFTTIRCFNSFASASFFSRFSSSSFAVTSMPALSKKGIVPLVFVACSRR